MNMRINFELNEVNVDTIYSRQEWAANRVHALSWLSAGDLNYTFVFAIILRITTLFPKVAGLGLKIILEGNSSTASHSISFSFCLSIHSTFSIVHRKLISSEFNFLLKLISFICV